MAKIISPKINEIAITLKSKFESEMHRRGIKTNEEPFYQNPRIYLDVRGVPNYIKKAGLVEEYPTIMSGGKNFLYGSYLVFYLIPISIAPDGKITWKRGSIEFDSEGKEENILIDKSYWGRYDDDLLSRMIYKMYIKELAKLKEHGIMTVLELIEKKDENGKPIYYHRG